MGTKPKFDTKQLIKELRGLIEEACKTSVSRAEIGTLLSAELILRQQLKDRSEIVEPWENYPQVQEFIQGELLELTKPELPK